MATVRIDVDPQSLGLLLDTNKKMIELENEAARSPLGITPERARQMRRLQQDFVDEARSLLGLPVQGA